MTVTKIDEFRHSLRGRPEAQLSNSGLRLFVERARAVGLRVPEIDADEDVEPLSSLDHLILGALRLRHEIECLGDLADGQRIAVDAVLLPLLISVVRHLTAPWNQSLPTRIKRPLARLVDPLLVHFFGK